MVNNFTTINNYIFAGTSEGVYRSTDTGKLDNDSITL